MVVNLSNLDPIGRSECFDTLLTGNLFDRELLEPTPFFNRVHGEKRNTLAEAEPDDSNLVTSGFLHHSFSSQLLKLPSH